MPYVITGFALVIAALLAVGLVLTAQVTRSRKLSRDFSSLLVRFSTLDKQLKLSERAAIVAEVAALDAVVGKLAKSMRSQFGTIHAKLAQLETPAPADPPSNGERPSRDQLRALYLKVPQVAKDE